MEDVTQDVEDDAPRPPPRTKLTRVAAAPLPLPLLPTLHPQL